MDPDNDINGTMPKPISGKRAKKEHTTVIALRLLKRCTSQIDAIWKIFVNVGSAASTPISKLLAPISIAIPTKKAPPVSVVIASVASPSPITIFKPLCISASESCF